MTEQTSSISTTGSALPKKTRKYTYSLMVMTLNEVIGMKAVMPKINRDWVDQIIVVDGGSTDGTIEWALAQGYEVYVQQKKGFRSAYLEVWPKLRGQVVIYFTPDGNTVPEAVPQIVDKMEEGYDLVIGSRYLGPAKSDDDDLVTGFGNWMFRTLINLLLNKPGQPKMTDPMVMFRAHKKNLPHRLGLDKPEPFEGLEKLFNTKVDWIPLMSMRVLKWGIRWSEIPADEPARIGGVRKLQILKWGAIFLIQTFSEFVRPAQKPLSE